MRQLGQHFMTDQYALRAIVDALGLSSNDTIIEIGPGKGAITDKLREERRKKRKKIRVIAIEKDGALAKVLQKKYAGEQHTQVLLGDALVLLPRITSFSSLTSFPYKIVGNIPYYITGKLLRVITELENPPQCTVLTVQREVADRLTAKPPRMNLLGAIAQHAGNIEIIKHLKPGAFSPPPKVRSSIIKIAAMHPHTKKDAAYYQFLKTAFAYPRKKLINNLSPRYPRERIANTFRQLNLVSTIRAHELSTKNLEALYALL